MRQSLPSLAAVENPEGAYSAAQSLTLYAAKPDNPLRNQGSLPLRHQGWPLAQAMHTGVARLETRQQTAFEPARGDRKRGLRILAKSIYRDLEAQGYSEGEIVALAGDLIGEVTTRLAERP